MCWGGVCESGGMSESAAKPLTRPEVLEAKRMRAVELWEQGRSLGEIARWLGVARESVRRWKRSWEAGGVEALRRRPAPGPAPKVDDAGAERVRAALLEGAQAQGFDAQLWTVERVRQVVARECGVELSTSSVWRLLTVRLGFSSQRPQRVAAERDEAELARWVATEWPRIKGGP